MEQSTTSRPPLNLSTNVFYGIGSIAFEIHQAALTSLLLLFFNQVVGLPAAYHLATLCHLLDAVFGGSQAGDGGSRAIVQLVVVPNVGERVPLRAGLQIHHD
jgi:hypothetical protein